MCADDFLVVRAVGKKGGQGTCYFIVQSGGEKTRALGRQPGGAGMCARVFPLSAQWARGRAKIFVTFPFKVVER